MFFMASAHSFDENTKKALRECGFRYITDVFARSNYQKYGMIFLPICNSLRRVRTLSCKRKSVTVVTHTNDLSDVLINRYRDICLSLRTGDLVNNKQLMLETSLINIENSWINECRVKYDELVELSVLKINGKISMIKRMLFRNE